MMARKTNAVAFHIPAGKGACRPPPKQFCNQTKPGRENISIETEKQNMAERRKNVRLTTVLLTIFFAFNLQGTDLGVMFGHNFS